MIAYLNDFWLMYVMVLLSVPLLLFLRPPPKDAQGGVEHVAME
jgi:DHA2 family multidrug resistance protein